MKPVVSRLFILLGVCALFVVLGTVYQILRSRTVVSEDPVSVVAPILRTRTESHRVGEVLTYDVKMGIIKLGTSIFRQLPGEEIEGIWTQVMLFETSVTRFKDIERIYSDPETFLPLRVERDIVNFFSQENIVETYDQEKFTLTISKQAGRKEEEIRIEKDSPIQHPILLTHYVRDLPGLAVGKELNVSLPKKSLQITITSIEDITVPAGTFTAYRFESSPKQIAIWISADRRRLPLKIMGLGAVNYVMLLRDFEGGTL